MTKASLQECLGPRARVFKTHFRNDVSPHKNTEKNAMLAGTLKSQLWLKSLFFSVALGLQTSLLPMGIRIFSRMCLENSRAWTQIFLKTGFCHFRAEKFVFNCPVDVNSLTCFLTLHAIFLPGSLGLLAGLKFISCWLP